MSRWLSIILLAFAAFNYSVATCPIHKSLHYIARYRWGLIKIDAGYADISYNIDGNNLHGTFDGQSVPLRGRIYCINDTLHATMAPSHETVKYENGWYTKPLQCELLEGNYTRNASANYKTINGEGTLDASNGTMEAVTITADIIGLFYYLHELDLDSMSKGDHFVIPINMPDGSIGKLAMTYRGKKKYADEPCHHITFEYSYKGKLSKYPVTCMVSQKTRDPLLFSANIKIGHVELALRE